MQMSSSKSAKIYGVRRGKMKGATTG